MDEELRVETATLPAGEYARVKKFFDNVFGADAQNVVLVKN
jgi:predicted enzyme related to lactoylglutathione lyase